MRRGCSTSAAVDDVGVRSRLRLRPVPTAFDAVRGKSFDARGPYAGHGAMWKVALRESDAETHLARCLDRFAVSMDDEADVCALRERLC